MKLNNELTKQECTVLSLVVKGWRNAKIADELFISIRTVETHLYHIFDKLGVASRTEAALYMLHSDLSFRSEIHESSDNSINRSDYTTIG